MSKHIAMATLALVALVAGGPVQAAGAVDIGMPMALTGYLAAFDGHAVDGAKLAAKLLNQQDGAAGHPIELHILDNTSNATTGVTVVNELINKYNVAAIASGALSAQTVAIEPIVKKNRVPVITMSVLPSATMEWTFSMALPPAKLLGLELGFAATGLKAKRIAFLYSQTPYGQIAARILPEIVGKHGQEAVFNEGVAVGSTDLTPQMARLKETKPDAIVDFLTGPVHLVETKAAGTVGLTLPIIMAIDDATTFRQAAGVYKDCYFVMSPIQTYPNVPDPEVAAATKRYLDAFAASGIDKREVGNAGEGWDLIHMYAQLFAKSPELRGDQLRDALMHLDYVGAYGRYRYRAEDHTGQKDVPVPMQITHLENDKFQVVGTPQPLTRMKDGPILTAEDVSVRYGGVEALQPISLSIEPGGLLLVLGPNGAGKSSLLRALAGAVPLRSGRIILAGRDVSRLPAHRRSRAGMALVPEGRGRLPGLTVAENLELGRRAAGDRAADRHSELAAVFELFPPLRERLRQDCSTLSGGEMQMLAIARALLMKPSLLMLDEPSLGLAPQATARVYRALDALGASGLAMLVVEQKAVPLPRSRETTIVLRNGRLVFRRDQRPSTEELARLYLGDRAA